LATSCILRRASDARPRLGAQVTFHRTDILVSVALIFILCIPQQGFLAPPVAVIAFTVYYSIGSIRPIVAFWFTLRPTKAKVRRDQQRAPTGDEVLLYRLEC